MSSQRKIVKRENLNYIDLLQQTIEQSEGQGDPLSEQIIEEEMVVDDYEQEKKVDLDAFEVSVDNQYDISADARSGAKHDGGDSDDEIRIVLKRKRPRGGGQCPDNASLNDIYMLLLNMDKRITNIEKWLKNSSTASVVVTNSSVVTRLLPMKSVQELRDFDEMLDDTDFETAFINFVQNAELKDMMDDNLIINFNYSGVHRKLAMKDFRFIQVWKDHSNLPESEFAKNLKIEIGAAHNRHHSRQARLRKSNSGAST